FIRIPPSALTAAFAGVDVLFLISYPSHVRDYRVQVQLPAIDAARRAGVSHIFYSSLAFCGAKENDVSSAEVMQAHLATEAYLARLAAADSGFTYTVVREGLYAESTPIYTAFFKPTGGSDGRREKEVEEVLIPHDGEGPGVAWVARDELGEATARLIARYVAAAAGGGPSFPWVNGRVLLTGEKVWSLKETVEALSKVAGRKVKIREVSVEEYVGLPEVKAVFGEDGVKARTWATAWEAIRAGETAVVSGELEEILGRKPRGFEEVLEECWRR
ncbi:hypothetical protein B0T17DRAFT_528241, partial [Bombardia bombarda]